MQLEWLFLTCDDKEEVIRSLQTSYLTTRIEKTRRKKQQAIKFHFYLDGMFVMMVLIAISFDRFSICC